MPFVKSTHEEVLKTHPNLADFLPFLDALNNESPRGAVLIACSYIEDQLANIIDSYLVEGSAKQDLLRGFNAPLGTFAARIKMAHGLGLITDYEKDDCECLRKIRNEFAHNHRIDFSDDKIISLCMKLHFSAKDYAAVTVKAEGQVRSGCVALILNLMNRPHYVKKFRLNSRTWPY